MSSRGVAGETAGQQGREGAAQGGNRHGAQVEQIRDRHGIVSRPGEGEGGRRTYTEILDPTGILSTQKRENRKKRNPLFG